MDSLIARLEAEIRRHQSLYDLGIPEIDDSRFDGLIEKMRKLSPRNPVLSEIGRKPASAKKVRHDFPMLSLSKCRDERELLAWAQHDHGDRAHVVMPKYDGVSMSLTYNHGVLVSAVTRGDGVEGENVLHNLRHVVGVPLKIDPKCKLTVRGEVCFSKDQWKLLEPSFKAKAEKDAEKGGKARNVNARNMAAGIVQQKNAKVELLTKLTFMTYDVVRETESDHGLYHEMMLLEQDDFVTSPMWVTSVVPPADFMDIIEEATEWCNRVCPFETDGLVVKVDEYVLREEMGATSHHPRWATAFKWKAQESTTTLRSIEWQVARTGTITPVGNVDPVLLSGAMVERVSLHNLGIMNKLGVSPGCEVSMSRRGGVIPHVEKVVRKSNVSMILPKRCPSCREALVREGDFLQCENYVCPAQVEGRLLYWCQTTDMMGWGEEVIAKLVKEELAQEIVELYHLDKEDMTELFGKNLGPKLLRERDAKAKMSPATLLAGLGIDGIGKTQAQKALDAIPFVELTGCATPVLAMGEVAEFSARLGAGFGDVLARKLLEGLSEHEVAIASIVQYVKLEEAQKVDGPFNGKKFVFTGPLSDMSRDEAQERVRMLGGVTPSGVTKDLAYLVVGDNADSSQTTKRDKAKAYIAKGAKIKIINEVEFLELIAEASDGQGC